MTKEIFKTCSALFLIITTTPVIGQEKSPEWNLKECTANCKHEGNCPTQKAEGLCIEKCAADVKELSKKPNVDWKSWLKETVNKCRTHGSTDTSPMQKWKARHKAQQRRGGKFEAIRPEYGHGSDPQRKQGYGHGSDVHA